MLRKPGPATSTLVTPATSVTFPASSSATSGGERLNRPARRSATFVAKSPWEGSEGRSIWTGTPAISESAPDRRLMASLT
jgi:hypothetical protein